MFCKKLEIFRRRKNDGIKLQEFEISTTYGTRMNSAGVLYLSRLNISSMFVILLKFSKVKYDTRIRKESVRVFCKKLEIFRRKKTHTESSFRNFEISNRYSTRMNSAGVPFCTYPVKQQRLLNVGSDQKFVETPPHSPTSSMLAHIESELLPCGRESQCDKGIIHNDNL